MRLHDPAHAVEFPPCHRRQQNRNSSLFPAFINVSLQVSRKLLRRRIARLCPHLVIMTKLDKNIVPGAQTLHHRLPQPLPKKGRRTPPILCPVVHHYLLIKKMGKGHTPACLRISPHLFVGHRAVPDEPDLYFSLWTGSHQHEQHEHNNTSINTHSPV